MRRFGDPALPTPLVDALLASSGTPFGASRLEDETAVVAAGTAAGPLSFFLAEDLQDGQVMMDDLQILNLFRRRPNEMNRDSYT